MNRVLLLLATLTSVTYAFYIPGVAPTTYGENDKVDLLVNHVTPSVFHKQKKEDFVYSFDYYYKRLHFCRPEKLEKQAESLGSIIFGDRIYNSPFEISLLKDERCKSLCKSSYPALDAQFTNKLISNGFFYNWLIDGLPAARELTDQRTGTNFYGTGFELGTVDDNGIPHLANHFKIQIEYHNRGNNEYRIVGVTVQPSSWDRTEAECSGEYQPLTLNVDTTNEVVYTYDVIWVESDTIWATRWDKYLHVYDPKIQWFSLMNFSLIVVCLSIVIVHILFRALKNDLNRYNEMNLDDEFQEETGWKLVHGDVFREPEHTLLLSILTGSGVQLLLMVITAVGLALIGLLSPSNRGSLSTVMFILYALFGGVGSYVSGSLYKLFGGESWKTNMILTPITIPGIIMGTFTFLNFFLIAVKSSGAIPSGTFFAIIAIWLVVSIPLSLVGSIVALKKEPLQFPVKTNQIARQIPTQPWYLKTWVAALVAGIFPFGSISVEMYFIYSSLWFNRVFYMFGFLFFCVLLMALTTALVTILMTYYTLCAENYKWQWRSVLIGGSCSVYIFLHAIILSKFQLGGFTTVVLYLGYSMLISFLTFVVTGSIGFLSSLFFVRKIYSAVKID